MCAEVGDLRAKVPHWQSLGENTLLREAAVCIFSSQMIFEVAEGAALKLELMGLLDPRAFRRSAGEYERQVVAALSQPVTFEVGDRVRRARPRFRNRLASLLARTVRDLYQGRTSLRALLRSAESPRQARELLVNRVWGFGPKQASLFLRRVGYASDLAVLDTHVLYYLRLRDGTNHKVGSLSRLSAYECLEAEFKRLAMDLGYPVGCVDLATWVTMRVARREALA
jgi:N-glycosylase/DNA lyase